MALCYFGRTCEGGNAGLYQVLISGGDDIHIVAEKENTTGSKVSEYGSIIWVKEVYSHVLYFLTNAWLLGQFQYGLTWKNTIFYDVEVLSRTTRV
ncbi:unnamed protein product [Clonostachys rosea]|uniref:Uncharacterized protein n=1 Tax=Bionectria ochroleuca TaxID=29856 RepID=A0ABY6UMY1_BIOOC|nr:unnamed protein product [Clonostachys rosea]